MNALSSAADPSAPLHIGPERLRTLLDYSSLVDAIGEIFRADCEAPVRQHYAVAVPGGSDATLLLMPAWVPGRYIGTKVASVFPNNGVRGLPAVQSIYLLCSGETGEVLATIDGSVLTTRRTVAASSLAARYLARASASRLLVIGTGQVAREIAASHRTVRPIHEVQIWGRAKAKAGALAGELRAQGFAAEAVEDLEAAVRAADIVSCATLSRDPIVRGEWLSPGTHLDLIGGFTPAMREVDDEALRRSSVFIDTQGARHEAGDIVQPLRSGVLNPDRIVADLSDLVGCRHHGRSSGTEITLFKSVGASVEDLAAATLAFQRSRPQSVSQAATDR